MKKVAVLGAGSWGTALAQVLHDNGTEAVLYSNVPEQIKEINEQHTNHNFLPELTLPEDLRATEELEEALDGADAVLFVVPTGAIRPVAAQVAKLLKQPTLIIHASKGLEQKTHKRISVVLEEEIPADKRKGIAVLSGPSHAEEVAVKDLTTITAASEHKDSAKEVQDLFLNDYFRVYTNQDVVGVELGGALKNIIALGSGLVSGLGYGDNAKAALMTRGLAEISRLGVAFGADPLTFLGLSGVGDLIVTCTSTHSRNWQAGNKLGQGQPLDEVMGNAKMVVEGVFTTKAAYELAQEKGISMPITEAIYAVLYQNKKPSDMISLLMKREGKSE